MTAAQDELDGSVKGHPVAHRHVDRPLGVVRAPDRATPSPAAGAIEVQVPARPGKLARRAASHVALVQAVQLVEVLRAANRGDVCADANVAREATSSWVQKAVAVQQQQVRALTGPSGTIKELEHRRSLAECEECRYVRQVRLHPYALVPDLFHAREAAHDERCHCHSVVVLIERDICAPNEAHRSVQMVLNFRKRRNIALYSPPFGLQLVHAYPFLHVIGVTACTGLSLHCPNPARLNVRAPQVCRIDTRAPVPLYTLLYRWRHASSRPGSVSRVSLELGPGFENPSPSSKLETRLAGPRSCFSKSPRIWAASAPSEKRFSLQPAKCLCRAGQLKPGRASSNGRRCGSCAPTDREEVQPVALESELLARLQLAEVVTRGASCGRRCGRPSAQDLTLTLNGLSRQSGLVQPNRQAPPSGGLAGPILNPKR